MNKLFLLLSLINSKINIKNIEYPACRNCIHFKPTYYDTNFNSIFNTCDKFGEKDIISDKISYEYANSCRNDEDKCGLEGKEFIEEKNINLKILKHKIISSIPNTMIIISYILFFLEIILLLKK